MRQYKKAVQLLRRDELVTTFQEVTSFRCHYCGYWVDPDDVQIDHVSPKYSYKLGDAPPKFDQDSPLNLVVACADCNQSKSAYGVNKWMYDTDTWCLCIMEQGWSFCSKGRTKFGNIPPAHPKLHRAVMDIRKNKRLRKEYGMMSVKQSTKFRAQRRLDIKEGKYNE